MTPRTEYMYTHTHTHTQVDAASFLLSVMDDDGRRG
jgi:hypothetical protein